MVKPPRRGREPVPCGTDGPPGTGGLGEGGPISLAMARHRQLRIVLEVLRKGFIQPSQLCYRAQRHCTLAFHPLFPYSHFVLWMKSLFLAPSLLAFSLVSTISSEPPGADSHLHSLVTLDTPRQFPVISSRKEWEQRAVSIREQVLVSCGLWPLPARSPLNAHVFGKIQRDGYSVEKVYLETLPGFYLGGNLYRPAGKGPGPFPAILNPHGHWNDGRLADTKDGSIPARCINFARQGMIAFSYDMVAFNDTHFADTPTNRPFYQLHREFATNRTDLLWNISLMGLQTWNSIRALDFLESLPDADRHRLACTGESGGGTQTFMLGAIDNRLAAQAPVVMVSHTMQGGCLCENAPGLRVEYSNMELAAAAAPRPQILVAASGDWTKDTLTVEGPAIEHIYRLFNQPEHLKYVRFDFGHNYNQTSREAVYGWFAHWLLKCPTDTVVKESPYTVEPAAALRVFPDGGLPAGALGQDQVIALLRRNHQLAWNSLAPRDKSSLKKFQEVMYPAWRHTLQIDWPLPQAGAITPGKEAVRSEGQAGYSSQTLTVAGSSSGGVVEATCFRPKSSQSHSHTLVVLCDEKSDQGEHTGTNEPASLISALIQRGLAVLRIDRFSTGEPPDEFANFFCTYNRTKVQSRVRDLLTICAAARSLRLGNVPSRVLLVGTGHAGPWVLLAAPGADGVAADCCGLDVGDENGLLMPDLFCPGFLAMGGFQTPAMLAAGHPLCLFQTGNRFPISGIQVAYQSAKEVPQLQIHGGAISERELADWANKAAP